MRRVEFNCLLICFPILIITKPLEVLTEIEWINRRGQRNFLIIFCIQGFLVVLKGKFVDKPYGSDNVLLFKIENSRYLLLLLTLALEF